MAYDTEVGQEKLRAEFIDGVVKGFAEREYKFKQAVTLNNTSAWKNTYYRENPNPLTAAGGLGTKGQVPRGVLPPQGAVKWEQVSGYIGKFFYEGVIIWEDILSDNINTQARTLYRVSEHVTKDVDDYLWSILAEDATAITATTTRIQLVAITATKHWSGSSAAIIDDIMNARTLVAQSRYDTSNCMLFVNARDYRSIVKWVTDKGSQFNALANETATNGRVPGLAGVQFVQSESVPASHALLVVPKICATYRELVSFRTTTIEEPYVSIRVRAVEEGLLELTDPDAVVLIANTRGDDT